MNSSDPISNMNSEILSFIHMPMAERDVIMDASSLDPLTEDMEPLLITSASAHTDVDVTVQQIVFTCVVCVIAVISLVSNFLSLAVILRTRRLRRINNVLIVSLCLAHLIRSLVVMPTYLTITLALPTHTHPPLWICVFYYTTLSATEIAVVLSCALIALERVFIITRPLIYQRVVTRLCIAIVTGVVWVMAGLYGGLQSLRYVDSNNNSSITSNSNHSEDINNGNSTQIKSPLDCYAAPSLAFAICDFLIAFILELIAIVGAYTKICLVVKSQMKRISPSVVATSEVYHSEWTTQSGAARRASLSYNTRDSYLSSVREPSSTGDHPRSSRSFLPGEIHSEQSFDPSGGPSGSTRAVTGVFGARVEVLQRIQELEDIEDLEKDSSSSEINGRDCVGSDSAVNNNREYTCSRVGNVEASGVSVGSNLNYLNSFSQAVQQNQLVPQQQVQHDQTTEQQVHGQLIQVQHVQPQQPNIQQQPQVQQLHEQSPRQQQSYKTLQPYAQRQQSLNEGIVNSLPILTPILDNIGPIAAVVGSNNEVITDRAVTANTSVNSYSEQTVNRLNLSQASKTNAASNESIIPSTDASDTERRRRSSVTFRLDDQDIEAQVGPMRDEIGTQVGPVRVPPRVRSRSLDSAIIPPSTTYHRSRHSIPPTPSDTSPHAGRLFLYPPSTISHTRRSSDSSVVTSQVTSPVTSRRSSSPTLVQLLSHNKALKMTLIVVGGFIACWLPIKLYGLLVATDDWLLADITWNIVQCLSFTSSAIDPFIYNFYSSEVRRAVKRFLSCDSDKPDNPWY